MERRSFLHILGMFSSATVLSGCGSETDQKKLISYLVPPEDGVIPGEAVWSFSSCQECPAGCGLMVRTREGLPVKLEGLAGHPVNDGKLCMRGQSALSRLYQNERIQQPLIKRGNGFEPIGWDEALDLVRTALQKTDRKHHYLSGHTSGSLRTLTEQFCQQFKVQKTADFELLNQASVRHANRLLFRQAAVPTYRLDQADLLVTLGADLLASELNPVGWGRQLAAARERQLKWTHLESQTSLTGASAPHRLEVKPGSEVTLLGYLLTRILASDPARPLPDDVRQKIPLVTIEQAVAATGLPASAIHPLSQRLIAAKQPLLLVGGTTTAQGEGLQAALFAGLIQWCLGMVGSTVDFNRRLTDDGWGDLNDLADLEQALDADQVGVLLLSRTGLADRLPTQHPLLQALPKASLRVGLGLTLDSTLAQCDLLLPLHHGLESWGDTAPQTGVTGLLKPALKPQFSTRSEGDILLQLMQQKVSWQEYLFEQWNTKFSEAELKRLSEQGFVSRDVTTRLYLERTAVDAITALPKADDRLQLLLVPSVRGYDGRSFDLPLQQEIPDPLTTISWGRWLSISPALAAAQGLHDRDHVTLEVDGWKAVLPVKLQPGQNAQTLCLHLGLQETMPPITANQAGEAVLRYAVTRLVKTDGQALLPILSGSTSQHGRGIIPDPVHLDEKHHAHPSMYEEHEHPDYNWGMVIDLDKCVGCNACVAACYVENNVPIVGATEHLKGREMSWLRIEPYYDEQGKVDFLPMMCQQCQKAPCEPVCPVYAAYHSREGLNVQVYSRCVGTRYCSNNCPYKVRRFNWFDHKPEGTLARMQNPDLAIRKQGMMEKCTFCIQRIREAKDRAKDEDRLVAEGEMIPACAQTCPGGAITFGNLLDKESAVYGLTQSKRAYRVFDELGTDSSVTYLKPEKH